MKIILLQDVAKVGRKNEIKEVNDGFARNFLIGKSKAVVATPANVSRVLGLKQGKLDMANKTLGLVDQFLSLMGEGPVVIKVRASQTGHLFASLHAKDIAEVIKKNFNLEFPVDLIILDKTIKEVGETKIALKTGDSCKDFILKVESL